MILGISASGRKDGITSKTVKAILEASNGEYEYISLAGKKINGCIGCVKCAADNRCHVQDDWNEIGEKMLKADAIVFGAPNYYGTINALGHACLERTFCFRHRDRFKLAGKLGVVVSTGYPQKNDDPVQVVINKFMKSNMMPIIGMVSAHGYSQCYSCGQGLNCTTGNIVKDHGFIEKLEEEHYPLCFAQQDDTKFEAYKVGKMLGSIVQKKKN